MSDLRKLSRQVDPGELAPGLEIKRTLKNQK